MQSVEHSPIANAIAETNGELLGLRSYDHNEVVADGIVHAIGLCLAAIGLLPLLSAARNVSDSAEYASVWMYCIGLITMLGASAAYNLFPLGACKWFLRRCDKSAIYVMIAATSTPFIVRAKGALMQSGFPILLWGAAAVAIALTFIVQNRYRRSSVLSYVAFAWGAAVIYAPVWLTLSSSTLSLIAAGGFLYSVGVPIFVWQRLRYQQVIWHGFVVLAAICHFWAVLSCISQS